MGKIQEEDCTTSEGVIGGKYTEGKNGGIGNWSIVKTTKTVGSQFYAGTAIPLDTPVVFDTTEKIKIKTWSPKADIPVRLKLENGDGDFIELDVNTTVTNQWEELVWDFSGMNTTPEFTTIVVFFEFVVDLPGDGTTYYFDDIDYAN